MGREESLRVKKFALILVKEVRIPNSRLPLNNELSFRVMFWSLREGMPAKGIFGQAGMHSNGVFSLACGDQNPFNWGQSRHFLDRG